MKLRLDEVGIGLSGLCLAHCLATPVIVLLVPALASSVFENEWIHIALLIVALPISTFAFVRGLSQHKCTHPGALGLAGLIALGSGIAIPEYETLLTVFGALLLASGHLFNQRLTTRPA